jgi:hypothetical protein
MGYSCFTADEKALNAGVAIVPGPGRDQESAYTMLVQKERQRPTLFIHRPVKVPSATPHVLWFFTDTTLPSPLHAPCGFCAGFASGWSFGFLCVVSTKVPTRPTRPC